MTSRERLTLAIEIACAITGKQFIEREHTLEVIGGPKYTWTDDGQIRSIIRDGKSFGPDGERKMK